MTIKSLPSGYWHVRLSADRFAQWQRGTTPKWENFFPLDWWTKQERAAAVREVTRREKESAR